ncbi:methionyl-tRNA formyltransferase [Chlamydia muridarum str. Nigg]|uniref:Methionyl-tRNA formyltransferase n=1 Tax=Chlamydia muridarum TaxID=83560 RepID=A0A070A1Y7_CHLMR|nr:methionyl-tRNA formyltransferase [Chlamydia muridarum]UFX24960.1 methionyl-tRNA formyltransferase [Chlamydia trachomatis]AHH23203.1 methionyl-tRNA formyltransferase [Chlamydia muridarum str. Nigg3 CMUT3-5]AHH24129.1 methionyl-tRNA formyltransferase [Chlamydia muridarum str. Nigg CM972]AID38330.1 methionyl-tRNA formyltransferase [Chlamydia muridarum str. Nigg 2 MCR]AIT91122.1 methionyl-tRNA formyltransferase [Chlamydia muridarum]
MNLRVVYLGTPQFAATVLETLVDARIHVVGVVTRADKPQKRSSKPIASPVKQLALSKNIPLLQPTKTTDPAFLAQLREWQADVFVVVAYGVILKQELLDIPKYGCYNLHAGLLPAYRGAAPIQRCIIAGETLSGNTVIRMDAGMDTGDIANVNHVAIGEDMTAGELAEALAGSGGELILKTLQEIEAGTVRHIPQDSAKATLAPKLTKEEGLVKWDAPASQVYAHIRGVSPAPGAWTRFLSQGKEPRRLGILSARMESSSGSHSPGEVLGVSGEDLLVACRQGVLRLCIVQPEGKVFMKAKDFFNGQSRSVALLF